MTDGVGGGARRRKERGKREKKWQATCVETIRENLAEIGGAERYLASVKAGRRTERLMNGARGRS
jgi:hypothetical protein